jgi:hypothetical protein
MKGKMKASADEQTELRNNRHLSQSQSHQIKVNCTELSLIKVTTPYRFPFPTTALAPTIQPVRAKKFQFTSAEVCKIELE